MTHLATAGILASRRAAPSNSHSTDLEASSSQYWSITDAAQTGLGITSDVSIEGWINLEQLPTTASSSMYIAGKDDGTNRSYYVFLRSTDDKLIFDYFSGGSINRIQTDSAFVVSGDVGSWVHMAVTVDVSAATGTMYKNRSTVASSTAIDNGGGAIDNDPANFAVGARGDGASYLDGKTDDVRVWSDIRTSTEISNNYQTELTGTETNLEGYWKFNNDGTDETANGNDLTNNNSATFSTDVPF